MFVSKKKYALVLARYELAASRADRADRAERQLAEIDGLAQRNGGLYKCILECREAAMAVAHPGRESVSLTTARLAFIDRRLSAMLPALTLRMANGDRQMWNDMLVSRSAAMAYGLASRQPKEETL